MLSLGLAALKKNAFTGVGTAMSENLEPLSLITLKFGITGVESTLPWVIVAQLSLESYTLLFDEKLSTYFGEFHS